VKRKPFLLTTQIMKIDIVSGVVLIFCIGVFASALASSDLFTRSDAPAAVTAQLKE
jgi:hypothetical protein